MGEDGEVCQDLILKHVLLKDQRGGDRTGWWCRTYQLRARAVGGPVYGMNGDEQGYRGPV